MGECLPGLHRYGSGLPDLVSKPVFKLDYAIDIIVKTDDVDYCRI